jgi:hypothetical protein
MSNAPTVKTGEWIYVGSIRCVVSTVRKDAICEVVFDPIKPTNRDAYWTGTSWSFTESEDFGGYADKYPRLNPYVQILKRGE